MDCRYASCTRVSIFLIISIWLSVYLQTLLSYMLIVVCVLLLVLIVPCFSYCLVYFPHLARLFAFDFSDINIENESYMIRHEDILLKCETERLKSKLVEKFVDTWLLQVSNTTQKGYYDIRGLAYEILDSFFDQLTVRLLNCDLDLLLAEILDLANKKLLHGSTNKEVDMGGNLYNSDDLRRFIDSCLSHFLDKKHNSCTVAKNLFVEVLLVNVFQPLLSSLSNPKFVHGHLSEFLMRSFPINFVESEVAPSPIKKILSDICQVSSHREEDFDKSNFLSLDKRNRMRGKSAAGSELIGYSVACGDFASQISHSTSTPSLYQSDACEMNLKSLCARNDAKTAVTPPQNRLDSDLSMLSSSVTNLLPKSLFENICILKTDKVIDKRGKPYILYVIKYLAWFDSPDVNCLIPKQRIVKRRYKEFCTLFKCLSENKGIKGYLGSIRGPDLRSRLIFDNLDERRIAMRITFLNNFLQELIKIPEICISRELKHFLNYDLLESEYRASPRRYSDPPKELGDAAQIEMTPSNIEASSPEGYFVSDAASCEQDLVDVNISLFGVSYADEEGKECESIRARSSDCRRSWQNRWPNKSLGSRFLENRNLNLSRNDADNGRRLAEALVTFLDKLVQCIHSSQFDGILDIVKPGLCRLLMVLVLIHWESAKRWLTSRRSATLLLRWFQDVIFGENNVTTDAVDETSESLAKRSKNIILSVLNFKFQSVRRIFSIHFDQLASLLVNATSTEVSNKGFVSSAILSLAYNMSLLDSDLS